MRTLLWTSLVGLALVTGACKKKQDNMPEMPDMTKTVEPTQVDKGNADLVAARDHYALAARERLAKIDLQLQDLEQRTDAKSKETAATLRVRRVELATRLDAAKDRAAGDWDRFKQDVDQGLDTVEKDLHDALK